MKLIWHQLSYKCCRNSIRHRVANIWRYYYTWCIINRATLISFCLSYLGKTLALFVHYKKRLRCAEPYLYYSGKRLEPIHLLILTINLVKPEGEFKREARNLQTHLKSCFIFSSFCKQETFMYKGLLWQWFTTVMQRDELRQEIANKIPLSEYDGTKVSPTKSYFCAEKCIFQDLLWNDSI